MKSFFLMFVISSTRAENSEAIFLYLNRKIIHSQIPWAKLLFEQQCLQTLAELCSLVLIWNGWQEALFSPFCKREGGTDICLQTVVCKHNCKLFWKNIGKHFGNKRNIICIFTLTSKVFWKYFQVYASLYTQTLHNTSPSVLNKF